MVSNSKTAFTPPRGAFLCMQPLSLIKYHFSSIGKNRFPFFLQNYFFKKNAEFAIILELNGYSDCLKIG